MIGVSRYTPGGRGHRLLGQIEERPRGRRDLQALERDARTRRKIPYVLSRMVADGLIFSSLGEYRLTDEGEALLHHLDRTVAERDLRTRRAA